MKIQLNFASQNIKRNNLKNYLKIALNIDDDKKTTVRKSAKPVFLIPVIDCSGSMSSPASRDDYSSVYDRQNDVITTACCNFTVNSNVSLNSVSQIFSQPRCLRLSKLDCAKDATIELLDLMNEGDKFAIVSFDDNIYINRRPILVNNKNRSEIRESIRNIRTGGCTNISGALKTAFDLFTKEDISKYNCKIVLLSDGQANVGYDREEQFIPLMDKIVTKGISTSTIGLGDDYDLGIMEAISGNCAGSFNHISNALAIKDIFASELRTTQDVVCKDVVVKVMLPDMVAFKPNFNNYSEDISKDSISIKLGNLYTNKDIYYEFSVLGEDIEKVLIGVTVEYETTSGAKTKASVSKELLIVDDSEDIGENAVIVNEVMGIVKDRYIYNATKAATENDYAYANNCYAESKATLDSIATAYNCCEASASFATEMDTISNTITTASSDNLRSTFSASSKKLRNT